MGDQLSAVLVVGMHRSGTSLLSKRLAIHGYRFGENLIGAADDNPNGFFEDRDLVALHDHLLGGEVGWKCVAPPDLSKPDVSERAQRWLDDFVRKNGTRIGFKDPRVCRFLPIWQALLEKIRILFVIRNPAAVADSLLKRNGMDGVHAAALWVVYNYEALKAIRDYASSCLVVDYDRYVDDTEAVDANINAYIGAGSEGECHQLVDPDLRHNTNRWAGETRHWIFKKSMMFHEDVITSGVLAVDKHREFYDQVVAHFSFVDNLLKAESEVRRELVRLKSFYNGHEDLVTELEEQRAGVEGLKSELAEKRSIVERLKSEAALARQAETEANSQLDAVMASHSMKLTAPLRTGARLIRNFKQRFLSLRFNTKTRLKSHYKARLSRAQHRLIKSPQSILATNDLVSFRNFVQVAWIKRGLFPKEKYPAITISVVTYESQKWIDGFFESLHDQDYPLNSISLVFVDHSEGSTCYELLALKQQKMGNLFLDFQVAKRPNDGFGCGHDYAIRRTSTKHVLVTNIDVEFRPDTICQLVSAALRDPDAATWEARQSPYEHPKFVDPVSLSVNWSSHACILIAVDKYLEVGGYEKKIFMYAEDVELSYRFRRAGYRLRYVPTAVIDHFSYAEAGEVKPVQFKGSLLGNMAIRMRYGHVGDIVKGFALLFLVCLSDSGFPGSRKMAVQSFLDALKSAPYYLRSRVKSKALFPFRGFDYDITRCGAFYESGQRDSIPESTPLVSIVTRTVSGREGLLRQAMLSVVNQTYGRIEHVVVEDGGASARRLVSEISSQAGDGYVAKYIECERVGRSIAGNTGVECASGKFIVFLDDDDLLFPDHVETLIAAVHRTASDGAYSLAWETPVLYSDKAKGEYSEIDHFTHDTHRQEFDREILLKYNYLPIQAVLFKKELFDVCGGFDHDMTYLEDWVLWKRYAHNGNFVHVPKTTSMYKTPAHKDEDLDRVRLLHEAYEDARRRPVKKVKRVATS